MAALNYYTDLMAAAAYTENDPTTSEETAISMELNELGGFKPTLKVKDMMRGMRYKILGARKVTTKFGSRIVLDLEKHQLFLPSRYDRLSEEAVADLNKSKYCIVNKGPVLSTFILEFINVNQES